MERLDSLPRRIADVARSLQSETGSADTMSLAVRLAVEVVDGAEEAAISVIQRGSERAVETPAVTDEQCRAADAIQAESGEGPGLTAIWQEDVITVSDLATDRRWADWGPRVARETDFASLLCCRMFTLEESVGALSLYSTRPHAFSGTDSESAVAFAAHAAVAIAAARQDEHKDIAMDSRSLIGQATGIVMALYDVDAVRAFAVLKRLSSHGNVKLHKVAAEIVRTRQLPAVPPQDR